MTKAFYGVLDEEIGLLSYKVFDELGCIHIGNPPCPKLNVHISTLGCPGMNVWMYVNPLS
jgi:hypothetical protein